jgi:hypothetical protein
MLSRRPPRRAAVSLPLALSLGLALLAACSEPPRDVTGPVGRPAFAKSTAPDTGFIVVHAMKSDGTPAANITANVVGDLLAGGSGSYLGAATDGNGLATFKVPVKGTFCAWISPVDWSAFNADRNLIAPPNLKTGAVQGLADQAAVLTLPKGGQAPVTATTFAQNCKASRPITVNNTNPVDVYLTFVSATSIHVDIKNIDNNAFLYGPNGLMLYLMEPFAPVAAGKADTIPGFLHGARFADGGAGSTSFTLPWPNQPGSSYYLEMLVNGPGGTPLAFSAPVTGNGQIDLGTIVPEPLTCVVQTTPEAQGDGSPVDILPNPSFGYGADVRLFPVTSSFGVWWTQTEPAGGTYSMSYNSRTDMPPTPGLSSTLQLTLNFTVNAEGTCSAGSVSGTATTQSTLSAQVYCAAVSVTNGVITTRVTVVEGGLPVGFLDHSFNIKTSGESVPDASKYNTTSAFVDAGTVPSTCTRLNDPRFSDLGGA